MKTPKICKLSGKDKYIVILPEGYCAGKFERWLKKKKLHFLQPHKKMVRTRFSGPLINVKPMIRTNLTIISSHVKRDKPTMIRTKFPVYDKPRKRRAY